MKENAEMLEGSAEKGDESGHHWQSKSRRK